MNEILPYLLTGSSVVGCVYLVGTALVPWLWGKFKSKGTANPGPTVQDSRRVAGHNADALWAAYRVLHESAKSQETKAKVRDIWGEIEAEAGAPNVTG